MQIIEYPHPALRYPSKPLRRVDAELKRMVEEMFQQMYDAKGVGLAANQVDLPYRLFIMNPESDPAKKDQERVFINPVLSRPKGNKEGEEGCLSLPGLYGPVVRADRIAITGYSLEGQEQFLGLKGYEARIVQHESDHLDGMLFIDRLSPTNLAEARETLEEFEAVFQSKQRAGEIPDDAAILARLEELVKQRCA